MDLVFHISEDCFKKELISSCNLDCITYTLVQDTIISAWLQRSLLTWPEMTDIINILISCEFAYHMLNLASSARTKLYHAML